MSTSPTTDTVDRSRVLSRLLGMLRPYWGMLVIGLILLVLSTPCELFPALVWKYVADDLILRRGKPTPVLPALFSLGGRIHGKYALLSSSLVWLTLVYLAGEVFGTISTNLMNRVAQRFIRTLRNDVYLKLQNQAVAYLQRQRTGDLISRAIGDVDVLQEFIVNSIDVIVGEGLLWVATVVLVMFMDWRVASASLAPLIVVYVLLRIFNQRIKPIYTAARERAADITNRIQENLGGIIVIKIFGREQQEAERFRDATDAYYQQQIRAINARSLFFPFTRSIGFLSNVFTVGVGGYLILAEKGFSLGDLLAFRAYWWRLYGPVQTLARVNDMVQRAIAAARRVFEVLDAPDELPDHPQAAPLRAVRGAVELRDVSFHYPPEPGRAAAPVLQDVSMKIEPGQTVALCGPSGVGKTTILNLLLRFYDPTSGQVMLDGRDLQHVTRHDLRRHLALVQQETLLFNDSILDNIRYGQPSATMQQVIDAASAANAHHFIERLPAGYDTKVGERGVRLSGGQKQRISIARAFLSDPTILLLDEPTSSVEPDAENAIIAALDRLMVGRTTVLTSHRPSLINQADVVYVLRDGRISAFGSPDELAQRDEWFERFMRSVDDPADVASDK